jgi:hypothetical protein
MGWDQKEMRIVGRVSNHNSDQDVKDEADWEELKDRISHIIKEHRYEALNIDIL